MSGRKAEDGLTCKERGILRREKSDSFKLKYNLDLKKAPKENHILEYLNFLLGDMYINFDLSEYKENCNSKIIGLCKKCNKTHKFNLATILQGCLCPWCSGQIMDTETFKAKITEISGGKINVDKVVYKDSKTKVEVSCNICHHIWSPTASSLQSGFGCIKCGYESASEFRNKSHSEFLSDLAIKQPDIYPSRYKVISEYKNNIDKIELECNLCGKVFSTAPFNLLGGKACPFCIASRYETIISKKLDELGIKYIFNKSIKGCIAKERPLRIDFLIEDIKLAIEVDGYQHFIPNVKGYRVDQTFEQRIAYDNFKDKWLLDNGYILLRASDHHLRTENHVTIRQLKAILDECFADKSNPNIDYLKQFDFNRLIW